MDRVSNLGDQIVVCEVHRRAPGLAGRSSHRKTVDFAGLRRIGYTVYIAVIAIASLIAHDVEGYVGFVVVLTAAVISFFIWTKRSGAQFPIFPITVLFYVPSYATASLYGGQSKYTAQQTLMGELTVALFLGIATLIWSHLSASAPPRLWKRDRGVEMDVRTRQIMLCALLIGVAFELGTSSGWWSWMGSAYGTLRTIASSATLIGCFLYGAMWGRSQINLAERIIGAGLLVAILTAEASSLLLYAAILNVIAVCIGIFLSAQKVPWMAIAFSLLLAASLHSAESQMRARYWTNGMSASTSLGDVPGIMTEWFSLGIDNMINGSGDAQQNFADRASMLSMLLLVQQSSPQVIPYLGGQTYANFWRMLVPRFLMQDKIKSQTNLDILSVHYHLQTTKDVGTTTLSWGLIPEAYANFGTLGVVIAGLTFGALMGWLTSWTTGAPIISMRGFIALASTNVAIMSVAYDFSYMLLNLLQSIATMALLFWCLNATSKRP